MGRLGEQIAVLDGLNGFEDGSSTIDYDTSESDGRIGQMRADAAQYAQVTARGPAGIIATRRRNVIDASGGANYSGGSSYAPRLPLLPSSVGLAGIPSVLPTKRGVIDYSGGANYSGGSSWTSRLPLTPSNAGLAGSLISGGYGREGLGDEGYGRAGLGSPMRGADSDLCGAFASIELGRLGAMDPNDGRIGQNPAAVDQYARMIAPNVLVKQNVIDPSGGANYTGGSTYAPGMPLIVSNAGLAGLDAMPNKVLRKAIAKLRRAGVRMDAAAMEKSFGVKPLEALKRHAMGIQRVWGRLNVDQKSQAMQALRVLGKVRLSRANIVRAAQAT